MKKLIVGLFCLLLLLPLPVNGNMFYTASYDKTLGWRTQMFETDKGNPFYADPEIFEGAFFMKNANFSNYLVDILNSRNIKLINFSDDEKIPGPPGDTNIEAIFSKALYARLKSEGVFKGSQIDPKFRRGP